MVMFYMQQMIAEVRRKDVLSAMEELMYEYSKPDFQTKMHAICNDSCDACTKKAFTEELSAIRLELIEQFGYAPSINGWEKLGEEIEQFMFDPDVHQATDQIDILTTPELQAQLNEGEISFPDKVGAQLIDAHTNLQQKLAKFRERYVQENGANAEGEFGRLWKVVGGKSNGGVRVRAGQYLQSAAFLTRLEYGAQLRELNMSGERLHFEKVSGKGPTYGWVSITKLRQMQHIHQNPNADSTKLEKENKLPEKPKSKRSKASKFSTNLSEASTCASEENPKSDVPENFCNDPEMLKRTYGISVGA